MTVFKPTDLYKKYLSNGISISKLIHQLLEVLKLEGNESLKTESLEILKKLDLSSLEVYSDLEMLFVQTENEELKSLAMQIILEKRLQEGSQLLRWLPKKEVDPDFLLDLYLNVESREDSLSRGLRHFMENIFGKRYRSDYKINPKEALALELLVHKINLLDILGWELDYEFEDLEVYDGKVSRIVIDVLLKPIPSKFFQLFSALKELILRQCHLTDYYSLTSLEKLTLSGGEHPNIESIDEIEGLEELQNLKELNLSRNDICEIKGLESLNDLRKLDLSVNGIGKIDNLENLIHLEYLNLRRNGISKIENLDSLTNLKYLDLSENENIRRVEGLDNLEALETLKIGCNYLVNKIEGLDNLRNLKRLSFYCTGEMKDPRFFEYESFTVQYNEDGEGKIIDTEKHVREEEMNNYKNNVYYIKEIKGLESLDLLEELDLRGNKIKEIKGLDKLKNLKKLRLDYNEISEINNLDKLRNLEFLSISNNNLPRYHIIGDLCNEGYGVDAQKAVEYCKSKKTKGRKNNK